jgi:pilus assembly protein Flp/PilA
MQVFVANVKWFLVGEDGPTAVEYAVRPDLILVVCITIVSALGTNARRSFSKVNGTPS